MIVDFQSNQDVSLWEKGNIMSKIVIHNHILSSYMLKMFVFSVPLLN